MDQERINAMAKALLDMEMLERTTTGGRRIIAERLLAADDAWRAAHAESVAVERATLRDGTIAANPLAADGKPLLGRCDCGQGTHVCPLGKTGSAPRCTANELRDAYDAVVAEREGRPAPPSAELTEAKDHVRELWGIVFHHLGMTPDYDMDTNDIRASLAGHNAEFDRIDSECHAAKAELLNLRSQSGPARTAAGDALADACAKYDDDNLGWAGVMAALAAYRSTAPAPNFAPATDEEIGQAMDTYCSTPGLEAAFRVMLNGLIRARSLPARSAEVPPKHSVCECISGSSYATEDPAWRHCDVCGGLIATNPATGDYRSADVGVTEAMAIPVAQALAGYSRGVEQPEHIWRKAIPIAMKVLNAALAAAPRQERGTEVERLVAAAERVMDDSRIDLIDVGPVADLDIALSPFRGRASAPSASPAADPWTREQVEALVAAARRALNRFGDYAAHHRANGAHDKTARNQDHVADLFDSLCPFAALAEQDGDNAPPVLAPQPGEAPAAGAPAPDAGEWWCPDCKVEIASVNVTYQETHDERAGGCGCHVIWREKGSHSGEVAAPAPDRLAELAEEVGKSLIDVEVIDGLLSAAPMATFFLAFAADRRGGAR